MTEPASSPPAIKPLVGANHAETRYSSRNFRNDCVELVRTKPSEMRVVRNRHWFLLRRLAPTN